MTNPQINGNRSAPSRRARPGGNWRSDRSFFVHGGDVAREGHHLAEGFGRRHQPVGMSMHPDGAMAGPRLRHVPRPVRLRRCRCSAPDRGLEASVLRPGGRGCLEMSVLPLSSIARSLAVGVVRRAGPCGLPRLARGARPKLFLTFLVRLYNHLNKKVNRFEKKQNKEFPRRAKPFAKPWKRTRKK